MLTRDYQAPRGFSIVEVELQCVHCLEKMKSGEASLHKQMHRLEENQGKGSGTRQCICTRGLNPHCPRHGNYIRR